MDDGQDDLLDEFDVEPTPDVIVDETFQKRVVRVTRESNECHEILTPRPRASLVVDEVAGHVAHVSVLIAADPPVDRLVLADAFIDVAREALRGALHYLADRLGEGLVMRQGLSFIRCIHQMRDVVQLEYPLAQTSPSALLDALMETVCRMAGLRRLIDPGPGDEEWATAALRERSSYVSPEDADPLAAAADRFGRANADAAAIAIYTAIALRRCVETSEPWPGIPPAEG